MLLPSLLLLTAIAGICLAPPNILARGQFVNDIYEGSNSRSIRNNAANNNAAQQDATQELQEIFEPWRQRSQSRHEYDVPEQQSLSHIANSCSTRNSNCNRQRTADYNRKSAIFDSAYIDRAAANKVAPSERDTKSLLDPLEHVRANVDTKRTPSSATDIEELNEELPYGIQNVRKRVVRGNPSMEYYSKNMHGAPFHITYQSLCPTKRVSIPLETSGYEYRPSHYIEVTCAHHFTATYNYEFNKNKICSEAGFSCIQLNRTIHLVRRNKAATVECWESEIRIVPSGCECMWPKHDNGDIVAYHQAQKRFMPEANVKPNADYTAGEGYLQIPRQVQPLAMTASQRRGETPEGVGFDAYQFN